MSHAAITLMVSNTQELYFNSACCKQSLLLTVSNICTLILSVPNDFTADVRKGAWLLWYLNKYTSELHLKAGFRKCKCNEYQITYIVQQMEDIIKENKNTLVVWVDLENEFD